MGRKKKAAAPAEGAATASPGPPDAQQALPSASTNGQPSPPAATADAPPPAAAPPPDPPRPDFDELLKSAREWAVECGLKPPFTMNGPEEVPCRLYGRNYVVTVHEDGGKNRMGTARFNSEGRRAMWTIDGTYAG